MARMRVLDLAKPFALVLPEVQLPYQKIEPMEQLIFTVCAAIIYVVLAEAPVFVPGGSARPLASPDAVAWLRPALAMAHGSPLELGVLPILVAGFVVQLAAGARRMSVSLDIRSERALFQSAQKLLALAVAAAFGLLIAFTPGVYGTPADLPVLARLAIAAQIFGGSAVLVFVDEVLSKGYGLGTGVLLFTSLSTAVAFVWAALSLQGVDVPGISGSQTYGAVLNLVWGLTGRSLPYAISSAVFRGNGLPNIVDIAVAASVFFAAIYLATLRIDLQIRSTKIRGQAQTFPVRLAYTGVQPLLFTTSALAAFLLVSSSVSAIAGPASPLAQVLGVWDPRSALPTAGIAAFVVPLRAPSPLLFIARAVVYLAVACGLGAWFAGAWTRASGFAPADVAKQFKENNIVLVGKRDVSVAKELSRVIPHAATLGGLTVCALAAGADLLTPGWGSALTVAALNTFTTFELLASEGIVGPNGQMPTM